MAETAQHIFDERFEMVVEDLTPLAEDRRHALYLLPTDEFVEMQLARMPRAQALTGIDLSDPAHAQRNRLARDRLLRGDCIAEARRYGFRVLIIDGRLDVDQVTSRVERHFGLG